MANNNKQAMKAKYSNLSARTINILVALAALTISALLLIFAPRAFEVICEAFGCLLLFALVVLSALYAINYKPFNEQ